MSLSGRGQKTSRSGPGRPKKIKEEPILLESSKGLELTATIADKPINLFSRKGRNNFQLTLQVPEDASTTKKSVLGSPVKSKTSSKEKASTTSSPPRTTCKRRHSGSGLESGEPVVGSKSARHEKVKRESDDGGSGGCVEGPVRRTSLRSRGEKRVQWKMERGHLKKVEVESPSKSEGKKVQKNNKEKKKMNEKPEKSKKVKEVNAESPVKQSTQMKASKSESDSEADDVKEPPQSKDESTKKTQEESETESDNAHVIQNKLPKLNFCFKLEVLDCVPQEDAGNSADDASSSDLSDTETPNIVASNQAQNKEDDGQSKSGMGRDSSSAHQPSTVIIMVEEVDRSSSRGMDDASLVAPGDDMMEVYTSLAASEGSPTRGGSSNGRGAQYQDNFEDLLFGANSYEEEEGYSEDAGKVVQQEDVGRKTPKRRRLPSDKYQMCQYCEQLRVKEILDRHQRYSCKKSPVRVPVYHCKLCLFFSETPEGLVQHLTAHPPDFQPSVSLGNVCEVCSAEFETNKKKIYHEWKVHDYYGMRLAYQCEFCEKKFPTKWQHHVHVGYHTDRKNFMCDFCGKCFRSKQEVKDHQRLSHVKDRFQFQCPCCRIGIQTKEELERHECRMVAELIQQKGFRGVNQVVYVQESEEHGEGSANGTAPRVFFDLESISNSGQDGPVKVSERYMCEYCGVTFATKVQKFVHRKVEHGYRRVPQELKGHEKLECSVCNKSFACKESLKQHYEITHSTERNYPCPVCGKGFKRLRDAQYHKKTIHDKQYKFYCSTCGHGVHRKHYLKNHKCNRIHKNTRHDPPMMPAHEVQLTPHVSEASALITHQPQPVAMKEELVQISLPEASDHQVIAADNSNISAGQSIPGVLTPTDILSLLPASSQDQQWIIQENGGQILVIQAGLADQVEEAQEILVQTSDGDTAGAQEVAQICQAAAILSKM